MLKDYRALNRDSGAVQLVRDGTQLLSYRVVAGRDTLLLDETAFTADVFGSSAAADSITFRGTTRLGNVVIVYDLDADGYLLGIRGQLPSSAPRKQISPMTGDTLLLPSSRFVTMHAVSTSRSSTRQRFGERTVPSPGLRARTSTFWLLCSRRNAEQPSQRPTL
jgi:hypothetical protein